MEEKLPKEVSVVLVFSIPRGKQAKTIIKSIATYFDIKGSVQRINSRQSQRNISEENSGCDHDSLVKIIYEGKHYLNLGLFTLQVYFRFKDCNLVEFHFEEKQNFTSFGSIKSNIYELLRNSYEDDSNITEIPVHYSKGKSINWSLVKAFVDKCASLTALTESSDSSTEIEIQENENVNFLQSLKQASQFIEQKKLRKLKKTSSPTIKLERSKGSLSIGNLVLSKSNPKSWSTEQVNLVLLDTEIGVGLEEEEFQNIKVKGRDLENIIDALISFNGDKEAKISHGIIQPLGIEYPKIQHLIVRWVFNNLLDYK